MSKKRAVLIVFCFTLLLSLFTVFFRRCSLNEIRQFDDYTKELFCQEVSGNSISLHYTLKDPDLYKIKEPAPSLGTFQMDPVFTCAALENALYVLHSFSRSQLNASQQLTYDILEAHFNQNLVLAPFCLYDEPLAPLTGIQSQLPLLFAEYPLHDEEDVVLYLELLTKTPAYFQSLCQLEFSRQKSGLMMGRDALDDIILECESFLNNTGSHYLISSFEERLENLPLKSSAKQEYLASNKAHIEQYVFPAYETLIKQLKKLRALVTETESKGLCHFQSGKRYYQSLVSYETGSDRSIDELKKLLNAQVSSDLSTLKRTIQHAEISPNSDLFSAQGNVLEDSNPSAILMTLKKQIQGSFPECPKVNLSVKYVPKSMQDYSSPAFYMIPAIDDFKNNVIYINPQSLSDDISLFTTLAHEGYPGHLYQNVYYLSQHPTPIRSLLNYGGYTEGWATYCEMLSYYYSPLSRQESTILQKNNSLILGLYARADIGIHYDGWTNKEMQDFFADYGFTDEDSIQRIFDLIVSDPANYLKYYIGYLEFLELKKLAIKDWKNSFSQLHFHEVILKTGPAPFSILRNQILDAY